MTHTILVVEDEYFIAMEICGWLEEVHYDVIGPATGVIQALSLLQRHTPSACLLDINLRGEWSLPVAEELKLRGVPFVVTSAYSLELHQPSGLLHDVTNLGKPTQRDELLATLEQLLQ